MVDTVEMVVGYDQREAVAYHTFVQSVIDNSTIPVKFLPLNTRWRYGLLRRYKKIMGLKR